MAESEREKIEEIVAALTRELYSHDYVIGRREAKEVLGLKIADCPNALEKLVMDLFLAYSDEMELYTAYSPEVALGTQTTKAVVFDRAFIESTDVTYVFRTRREIKRLQVKREGVPLDAFQQRTLEEGWTTLK
jgi:radical SAM superfamily enzyme